MPELLLELFSEEIPARMQAGAAADLQHLVTDALMEAGLLYEAARAFATPRRLTLVVDGLPTAQPDRREERKGPRLDAPAQAMEGFLRAVGLSVDQLQTRADKKGTAHYIAVIERPGRPTAEVLAEILPELLRRFPWPKSMRWGEGTLRWVRPLHAILCTFDGEAVAFAIDGVQSGNLTFGHRFLAPGPIRVRRFEDYTDAIERAFVVLDPEQRARIIEQEAKNAAFVEHLEVVEDPALLREVSGLVEWPVVLMGRFDQAFLDLPPEVLQTAMRRHQKYFSLRDPHAGRLAPRFLTVANLPARDGGRAIIAGNERVLRARLADAKFFWDQDRKTRLEDRLPRLAEIVFYEKLGSMRDKVGRIRALARELAPVTGADTALAERAALLAKTDLVTGMVGEFPELQGIIGRYYARAEGEPEVVAEAIAAHYRPQGPEDALPEGPVAQAVALADKLDSLVGFWAIGERPTGSSDPFALRRAALGIIRIVLENSLRLPLAAHIAAARLRYQSPLMAAAVAGALVTSGNTAPVHRPKGDDRARIGTGRTHLTDLRPADEIVPDLLAFFADRLKVYLRERGVRHDVIAAIFALGGQDDLVLLVARARALQDFLASEDGANLLLAYRRAANILRIEEKKDGRSHAGRADPALFEQDEERALAAALGAVGIEAEGAIRREDFTAAMRALARLRAPVDRVFDHVTVNAEEPALRENRLRLLSQIRAALEAVADFSQIEG